MSDAFSQQGATVNLAVTASAQSLALTNSQGNIRISNIGTQTVFIDFQTTATLAGSIPVLANTVEMFAKGAVSSISAIAASTGSTIYVTSGAGI